MSVTIPKTQYEPIPTGEYQAVVKSVSMDEQGQFGPQVKVVFEVTGSTGAKKDLTGWASAVFNGKSKLYVWTKAILGGDPVGDFNGDALLGRLCKIQVIQQPSKADPSVINNKINLVLPVTAAAQTPF